MVTGVMASDNSTVAQLLAEQFPRAVHVRGDVFRRFIASGRVEPDPPITASAHEHLMLRYRLAMTVADTYASAGFTAVVQDVILGPVLAEVLAMIQTRPAYLIVLDPDARAVEARENGRIKSGYRAGWVPDQLVTALLHHAAPGTVARHHRPTPAADPRRDPRPLRRRVCPPC